MTARSRPLDVSSPADAPAPALPDAAQLAAIGELWKRTHRVFEARFDGTSMRPTIEPQQAVTVRCGESVHIGDVVLAIRSGTVIVHRIIWISTDNTWLLTSGDAFTVPDPPLAMSDVVGVVDASRAVPRRTQNVARLFVCAAARLGRTPARMAVRALQIAARR